jgi:hypothetical protein
MTMKLLLYTDGNRYIWILDTFGKPPTPKQVGLSLCRSLTLWADGLLLGPLEPDNRFLLLDPDGFPKKPGQPEAAAFGAFLRDEGILSPVIDGKQTFQLSSRALSRWQRVPFDLYKLLSL